MTLDQYIQTIDETVAGRDIYGGLRFHIQCSAEANANDMNGDWETNAVNTAKMIMDCWQDFYPQLII
jgi:hypothetical protein